MEHRPKSEKRASVLTPDPERMEKQWLMIQTLSAIAVDAQASLHSFETLATQSGWSAKLSREQVCREFLIFRSAAALVGLGHAAPGNWAVLEPFHKFHRNMIADLREAFEVEEELLSKRLIEYQGLFGADKDPTESAYKAASIFSRHCAHREPTAATLLFLGQVFLSTAREAKGCILRISNMHPADVATVADQLRNAPAAGCLSRASAFSILVATLITLLSTVAN
jgi:hypothetical protein